MCNGRAGKCFFAISSSGNGAVMCPALQRGRGPLALMKFAMRGLINLTR